MEILEHAEEWRDSVVTWFAKTSGTPKPSWLTIPNRIEAESMTMEGYQPKPATPWETASGVAVAGSVSSRPRETRYR